VTEENIQALRTATEHYKGVLKSSHGPHYDPRAADLVIHAGRLLVAHISDFLLLAEDVHIASCVDVMGADDDEEAYLTGVKRAREFIRTFETAKQALYDDGSVMLMASQAIHVSSVGKGSQPSKGVPGSSPADLLLQTAIPAISSNLGTVMETLEHLLDIAHEQIEVRSSQREMVGGPLEDHMYPIHPGPYQELFLPKQYPNAAEVLRTIGIPNDAGGDDGDPGDTISIGDALGPPRTRAPGRYGTLDDDTVRLSIDGGPAPSENTVRSGETIKPLPSIAGSSTAVSVQSGLTEDPNGDSDEGEFDRSK
jgi:son of sevenless-like protein